MRSSFAWVVVVLSACGHDLGGGGKTSLKATIGLDLPHIVGFALSGGPSARLADGASVDATQQLYAIDDQGNLIITTLTTSPDGDAGTTTTSAVPSAIFDTQKYTVFRFGNLHLDSSGDGQGIDCGAIIMRKTDGALYCYEGGWLDPGSGQRMGSFEHVQSNASDLLFVDGAPMTPYASTGVQRIDMAGNPPPTMSVLDTPAADFDVNVDGDVLVSLDVNPGSSTKGVRIYKQAGGLQNLFADHSWGQWLEPGGGHDFFYLYVDPAMGGVYVVGKATRQPDGGYVTSVAGTVSMFNSGNPQATTRVEVVMTAPGVAYLWRVSTMPTIVDLIGATQGTDHFLGPLTGFATILNVRASANSLFVQGTDAAGNGGITRLDVPAFTATSILPAGQFSLTAISPSKTGDLSFAGLRNSDGKRVIGTVPAGSSTYTISSETAPTVTYLQRIN